MDGNVLIEVIKSGLSLANTTVTAIVGAVITTLFLRKDTKTTEFEKIRAGRFDEVVKQLLDSGKMTYMEYYKCNNFLDIAKKADELLVKVTSEDKSDQEEKTYDFDWFIRFFDSASTISNEKMKGLWARVLAGEVYQSGSFSLRTLDTLYNMNVYEAELFERITRIVLDDQMIFSSMGNVGQTLNERFSFDNDVLRLLEECGLINGLMMKSQMELSPGESCGFTCGDQLLLLTSQSEERKVLEYSCYRLTMVGLQLYSLVSSKQDETYLLELGKALRKEYPFIKVSLHPMLGDGREEDIVSYNPDIDLLNE